MLARPSAGLLHQDDVTAAVKFFASDGADYITGQVLNVTGGWMI